MQQRFGILLLGLVLVACSGSKQAVIDDMATADDSREYEEIFAEANERWENRLQEEELRKAIDLYEIAYKKRPEHPELLDQLTVAYYQLAYAYEADTEKRIKLHDRGREFALKRLELHPGYAAVVKDGGDMGEAVAKIEDPKYVHAMNFAAANWGWSGELQGIQKLAFDIPKVKALFTRAVELDRNYLCSAPLLMAAGFYAKAGAFGGDIMKAKEYYDEAIEDDKCYDNKIYYAEFYAVPMDEQELFHELVTAVDNSPPDTESLLRLENRVAKDKAKKLLKEESDLF